jgi:hypothetical protein
MTTKSRESYWQEEELAAKALDEADPDANDATLARIVVEYMTSHPPPYCLSVFHDARPSALRRIERMRKIWPDWQPSNASGNAAGPCPLRYDRHHKNTVWIRTNNREEARRWGIEALLLGYALFHARKLGCHVAGGQGTLAEVRERARGRRAA